MISRFLVDIILIETEMDETIFGGGYGVSGFVLSDAYKCSSGSEKCNPLRKLLKRSLQLEC
jgi:hypothetical protein